MWDLFILREEMRGKCPSVARALERRQKETEADASSLGPQYVTRYFADRSVYLEQSGGLDRHSEICSPGRDHFGVVCSGGQARGRQCLCRGGRMPGGHIQMYQCCRALRTLHYTPLHNVRRLDLGGPPPGCGAAQGCD